MTKLDDDLNEATAGMTAPTPQTMIALMAHVDPVLGAQAARWIGMALASVGPAQTLSIVGQILAAPLVHGPVDDVTNTHLRTGVAGAALMNIAAELQDVIVTVTDLD